MVVLLSALPLLCIFGSSQALSSRREQHHLLRRALAFQPQPNFDTSDPARALAENEALSARYTREDSVSLAKRFNTASAARIPDLANYTGPDFLGALASLDFQPLGPVNNATPISPESSAVPKRLRPSQNNYTVHAAYAALTYCLNDYTVKNCGSTCRSLPKDFNIRMRFGDGGYNPITYVATVDSKKRLVVAHEGTNGSSIASLLNLAPYFPLPLVPDFTLGEHCNASLAVGSSAHIGVQAIFQRMYPEVSKVVKKALTTYAKGYEVLVVGHSLGGGMAQMTAISLKNELNPLLTKTLRLTTFGSIKPGNRAFTEYLDSVIGKENHVHFTNLKDPVPHIIPSIVGGVYNNNEMFFSGPTTSEGLVYCPGQDNQRCFSGTKNINSNGHRGPWFGIDMAACYFGEV